MALGTGFFSFAKISELCWLSAAVLSVAIGLKIVITIIYNVYFHPLRGFPGPLLARATPIPYVQRVLNGKMVSWSRDLHAKYGDAVRVTPDQIEFSSPAAWKAIHQARPELPRPATGPGSLIAPNGVRPIAFIVTAEDHARQRRILNHGFSERALQEQEHILQKYVDLLIEGLRRETKAGRAVDLSNWFNHYTVDIITDLCFGESWHSLDKGKYHPWMKIVFDGLKIAAFLNAFEFLEPLGTILSNIIPESIKWQLQRPLRQHFKEIQDMVAKRIESGVKRPDIMQYILENNQKSQGMTIGEIESTVNLTMIAGTDTSATTLAGATFLLLTHSDKFARLTREVRSAFNSGQDITAVNSAKLEYLNVVLRETLRLYPASPLALPKYVDRPLKVAGWHVPVGVRVGIPHQAANLLPRNFVEADTWVPERWLLEADLKFLADKKEMSQPFLVGPRACPGQNLAWTEMRLAMCKLIWNFNMTLSSDTSKVWLDQKVFHVFQKPPLNVKLSPTGLP